MYRSDPNQLEFEDFILPFGGHLSAGNRWVLLAKKIPWKDVETTYLKQFSSTMGSPAKSARIALGALIIKERLGTSDEETVLQIQENPYLQYFLGFEKYQEEAPFDPSMFVHFRKRFSLKSLQTLNEQFSKEEIDKRYSKEEDKTDDNDDQDKKDLSHCEAPSPDASSEESSSKSHDTPTDSHRGKLIIDATCTPADITYPTDLKVLNQAREASEKIIDCLHAPLRGKQKKPRMYRKKAHRHYLKAAMNKRLGKAARRKAIRKQLGYLRRNLSYIEELKQAVPLGRLKRVKYQKLLVSHEVYRQQKAMFDQRSNRIEYRIVSLSQPHVRPIVRGKLNAKTEFGAKVSASVIDGYFFLDHLSWDAYNESGDLKKQVEKYKKRFGVYPKSVHADRIYRTHDNRKFCTDRNIRLSGPRLGRPSQALKKEQKKQERADEIDRIEIEGKFGQGKRRFSMNRIMAKLPETSECVIGITFFVMNLEKWLRDYFLCLFLWAYGVCKSHSASSRSTTSTVCMIRNVYWYALNWCRPVS